MAHESRIQALSGSLQHDSRHPLHLALVILLDENNDNATPTNQCICTPRFDGDPAPMNGNADVQAMCVDSALQVYPRSAR